LLLLQVQGLIKATPHWIPPMIIYGDTLSKQRFEQETGWIIKPEGACKNDTCIPLPFDENTTEYPVTALAAAMNLPLVSAPEMNASALGHDSLGSNALKSAKAPDFALPDLNGTLHRLSDYLGQKVILYAWAPY